MGQDGHKIAQGAQDERQDEARWRQDAKNEGCLERFRPLQRAGPSRTRQQHSEPRGRGGVGEGLYPLPWYRGDKGFRSLFAKTLHALRLNASADLMSSSGRLARRPLFIYIYIYIQYIYI